jgi:hypothetical protein
MSGRVALVGLVLLTAASVAHAAPREVTVFLDRDGHVTDEGVEIPRFGGGERAWNAIVACVQRQYAPFAVDIVDRRPASGDYITAVIGGRASLLGLDDRSTNGVGPYDGNVLRTAVVHVFSQVGTGERDVENLCAVTAHEVGHALGLDHEVYCGDVMSYYLDRCGARRFIDADAPCGETAERECGSGDASQNSYRRLGELVGFRDARTPKTQPRPNPNPQPQPQPQPDDDSDDSDEVSPPERDPDADAPRTYDPRPSCSWRDRGRTTTYTIRRGRQLYRVRVTCS